MPQMNAFFALSGTSVWGVFISGDGVSGFKRTYIDYQSATDAVEIFRVGDKLITLRNDLSVYAASENEIRLVKKYPGISGKCCKKEGSILSVASTQGLFLYDITIWKIFNSFHKYIIDAGQLKRFRNFPCFASLRHKIWT